MRKINNDGFMLAETLVVTSFVAGVLIFLFIQFTNISKNYEDNYTYNTVDSLYALEDIKDYLLEDSIAFSTIETELNNKDYINITNCSIFENNDYCLKLFEIENVDQVIVSKNNFNKNNFENNDIDFLTFVKKISVKGNEKFRLIASFKNSTYATLRFGV